MFNFKYICFIEISAIVECIQKLNSYNNLHSDEALRPGQHLMIIFIIINQSFFHFNHLEITNILVFLLK